MARISSGSGHISEPSSSRSIKIEISHLPENELADSIDSILALNGGKGVFGVITNTVARASSFAKILSTRFGESNITVAHSRFVSVDRLVKDAEVLKIAGKDSIRDTFQIVIGTQVLEQSLDIDFDMLYSDLAPVDSIVQRMGRLHRHERLERSHRPRFAILDEPINDKGEAFVSARRIYGDWLIAVADQYFSSKSELLIPQAIRDAIEWLPEDYVSNPVYQNFTNTNLSVRKDKTRDFTLAKPTAKKNKSLHGAFSLDSAEGKTSNLIEAKVRNIDLPSLEVIALFEGEDGGIWVPQYQSGEEAEFYLSVDGRINWKEERAILSSTLRLPHYCANFDFVSAAEKLVDSNYGVLREHWKQLQNLKGELFIVFPSSKKLKIADMLMNYNSKTGLETTRV